VVPASACTTALSPDGTAPHSAGLLDSVMRTAAASAGSHAAGMVELSWLLARFSRCRLPPSDDHAAGSVPLRLLPPRSNTRSRVSRLNDEGSVPLSAFSCMVSTCKLVRYCSVSGSEPANPYIACRCGRVDCARTMVICVRIPCHLTLV
jgi:hypothetical protein